MNRVRSLVSDSFSSDDGSCNVKYKAMKRRKYDSDVLLPNVQPPSLAPTGSETSSAYDYEGLDRLVVESRSSGSLDDGSHLYYRNHQPIETPRDVAEYQCLDKINSTSIGKKAYDISDSVSNAFLAISPVNKLVGILEDTFGNAFFQDDPDQGFGIREKVDRQKDFTGRADSTIFEFNASERTYGQRKGTVQGKHVRDKFAASLLHYGGRPLESLAHDKNLTEPKGHASKQDKNAMETLQNDVKVACKEGKLSTITAQKSDDGSGELVAVTLWIRKHSDDSAHTENDRHANLRQWIEKKLSDGAIDGVENEEQHESQSLRPPGSTSQKLGGECLERKTSGYQKCDDIWDANTKEASEIVPNRREASARTLEAECLEWGGSWEELLGKTVETSKSPEEEGIEWRGSWEDIIGNTNDNVADSERGASGRQRVETRGKKPPITKGRTSTDSLHLCRDRGVELDMPTFLQTDTHGNFGKNEGGKKGKRPNSRENKNSHQTGRPPSGNFRPGTHLSLGPESELGSQIQSGQAMETRAQHFLFPSNNTWENRSRTTSLKQVPKRKQNTNLPHRCNDGGVELNLPQYMQELNNSEDTKSCHLEQSQSDYIWEDRKHLHGQQIRHTQSDSLWQDRKMQKLEYSMAAPYVHKKKRKAPRFWRKKGHC